MLKKLRIAILLYVLLFVAAATYLSQARSTDWNDSLWVDVYPVNADGSVAAQAHIERLQPDEFREIEEFFEINAGTYGIELERPFRIELAPQLHEAPPAIPSDGGWLDAVAWSLRMRWFAFKLNWASDRPTPDILLFALFHDGSNVDVLERSTALRKGLIAVANVYAARSTRGSNQVIVAHELLHTLGATDKYDLTTTLPLHPLGFAEPDREPLYPQMKAELMGGRIPLAPNEARIPPSLEHVVIGPATALEIGWQAAGPVSGS